MLLIGSKAIKFWFPDFPREPKDTDYAVDSGTRYPKEVGVEYLENPVLWNYYDKPYGLNIVCYPDDLYTLKMSHLFWDLNWEKHEWDATFLRKKGCILNRPLFNKLYDYFNILHGKNVRSDLKMTAKDFFDNALECEYDHDWLHTLLNPIPTFTKVLIGEVEVGEDKFEFFLNDEEKEELVREEVEIMAFERWPKLDHRKAYGRMLKKFIISHAPIWEAIWILENYPKLQKVRHNFIKILNEKINERGINIVKRSTRSIKKQKQLQSI